MYYNLILFTYKINYKKMCLFFVFKIKFNEGALWSFVVSAEFRQDAWISSYDGLVVQADLYHLFVTWKSDTTSVFEQLQPTLLLLHVSR